MDCPPFATTPAGWPHPRLGSLRVGSYNIQVDHDRDIGTDKEWRHRRALAAEAITALDCDLLLIQEPGPRMAAEMEADLGGEYSVAVQPCDPEMWACDDESAEDPKQPKVGQAYDGNGFIWRTSQLELLGEIQTTWLSKTPDVPSKGEPVAWDSSGFCRTCVDARFLHKATGKVIHAFSAHLDHHGKEARTESAKLVMGRAGAAVAEGTVVVVAGDFNTFPAPAGFGPQTYAALADAAEAVGFVDVRAAAGPGHVDLGVGEDSWKGWPGEKFCRAENHQNDATDSTELDTTAITRGRDVSRFDQMFVEKVAVVKLTGVVEQESWAAASDHVPIIAEFEL